MLGIWSIFKYSSCGIKNVLANHKLVSPCMMRSGLILHMGGRVMWTKNTPVYARALKMRGYGANLIRLLQKVARKWVLNT